MSCKQLAAVAFAMAFAVAHVGSAGCTCDTDHGARSREAAPDPTQDGAADPPHPPAAEPPSAAAHSTHDGAAVRAPPFAGPSGRPSAEPTPAAPERRGGNTHIASFRQAKQALVKLYDDHRTTLYCGCRYDARGVVDLGTCGFRSKTPRSAAPRIEWEHVVPAEAFGRSFPEWRDGHPECVDSRGRAFRGRNCARKTSSAFRHMEADMYNLFPAIAELNRDRSNFSMALLEGEARAYGTCDVEISDRKIEPRPEIRGDIARTYLYMHAVYPGRGIVSDKNQRLFQAWSAEDPVDRWECERAQRIRRVQQNDNPILAKLCPPGPQASPPR